MVWDKRSVELLDSEVGYFTLSCRFRCVEMVSSGSSQGFMDPFPEMVGSFFGKNSGL